MDTVQYVLDVHVGSGRSSNHCRYYEQSGWRNTPRPHFPGEAVIALVLLGRARGGQLSIFLDERLVLAQARSQTLGHPDINR